jgi:hypothetical protein
LDPACIVSVRFAMRSDAQRCAAMHLLWYASRRVVYAGEWLDAAETVLPSIIGWRTTCSSQTARRTARRTDRGREWVVDE